MPAQKPLSIFVFIDALGWALRERYRFGDGIFTHSAPLQTVLGYSCTCDPTIITGLLPREHGHFSFFVYDPARSPFSCIRPMRALPKLMSDRMRFRSRLSRALGKQLGYTGYFNLYQTPFELLPDLDYTEKRDLYQAGGIINGQDSIFDHLRRQHVPFHLSDWRANEATNLASLHAAIDQGQIRFAYLYLAELDGILHRDGCASEPVRAKLRSYEQALKRLQEHATQRYGAVRIFVFSDHGMNDVTQSADLMARIDMLGLEWGRDYAAVYDSTMARFWFIREDAEQRIRAALEAEPLGSILTEEALAHYGCDFEDHRYGQLFFLMQPGCVIVPSYMGLKRIAGMHGYAPEAEHSVAFFGSTVDASQFAVPRGLTELFPLMASEAGLEL
ncbi:MAG: alkaline phosphatase family protein [Myxococcota bacterium]|jgi:hypothetical protein|nr:alkaline phosphatase family protein [Myxococcota bacterium]